MTHDLTRVMHLCDVAKYHSELIYQQIGCGAVGSIQAVMMAKLGLKVFCQDNKDIQAHNVANQLLFGPGDVGTNKALRTHSLIERLASPDLAYGFSPFTYTAESFPRGQIVGMSVDTMEHTGRAAILQSLRGSPVIFFTDTRITAHYVNCFGVSMLDELAKKRYKATLFKDSEGEEDRAACGTVMGVADIANIAASMAHRQIMNFLNWSINPSSTCKPPFQLTFNINKWKFECYD